MKRVQIAALGVALALVGACETVEHYANEASDQVTSLITPEKRLRLESNKPGTAFCLAGRPVVAGDPGVTLQAGDRVYVVDPAPEAVTTVVAAQAGYFAFVDTASSNKVRLQFDFFERNRCTGSSAGRTCVTSELTSDLNAFERFCANFP
jgi:hypothetical protein